MAKERTYEQIQAQIRDPQRCRQEIYTGRGGHHRCLIKGKFERDGKWYCHAHDPITRKERDDARMEKWSAEQQRLRDAAGQRASDQIVGRKLREVNPTLYEELLRG